MSTEWYYGHDGQRLGPVSLEQLRHLIAADQLHAEDLVWRKGLDEWTPAGQIEGLFLPPPFPAIKGCKSGAANGGEASDPFCSLPRRQTSPAATTAKKTLHGRNALLENPLLIGVLLLPCFPVALYLVWKHSSWTNKTKWIWTGVWAAFMVVGVISRARAYIVWVPHDAKEEFLPS